MHRKKSWQTGGGERSGRETQTWKGEKEKKKKRGKKNVYSTLLYSTLLYNQSTNPLINARNQLPFHPSAVLFPILPILSQTPRVIPHAPLKQQSRHKHRVPPRQDIMHSAHRAPAVRKDQIPQVIRVTNDSPPSCDTRGSALCHRVR